MKKLILLLLLVPFTALATELNSTSLINDANLQAYYRMEGSSVATVGVNGTDTATLTYSALYGKYGQGVRVDGNTGKIVTSTYNYKPMTFVAWVYPTTDQYNYIISENSTAITEYTWRIDVTTGKQALGITGTALVGNSNTAVPLNQWSHVAVTYDGSGNFIFYYNGTADGSGTNNQTVTNTEAIQIGKYSTNASFAGNIDDIAVFNRVLSASEIASLAAAAPAAVSYPQNNDNWWFISNFLP